MSEECEACRLLGWDQHSFLDEGHAKVHESVRRAIASRDAENVRLKTENARLRELVFRVVSLELGYRHGLGSQEDLERSVQEARRALEREEP